MHPIKNWKQYKVGYRFGVKTFYNDFHLGIDIWTPEKVPVFAPFDGDAQKLVGKDGGNMIYFHPDGQTNTIRLLHLHSYVKTGRVKKGELIAYTGNTGKSTNPHIHIDIYKGRVVDINNRFGFINPETFNWGEDLMVNTKKVLVIFSQIDQQNISEIKTGIQRYVDKVKAKTNGEFELDLSYTEIDRRFSTIRNGNIVYVMPEEIGEEGHKAELAMKKEFDTVCLIYNNATVHGEQPTNPVENPITIEGFNPIQIPLNWLDQGDTALSASIFFAHENSHSDYYIVNTEGKLNLFDKTHDPYEQTPTYSPLDRFADLLIELKPYWRYLTTPQAQGDPMIQRQEDVKILRIDVNGTRGVLKLIGGRQLVGELASDPSDYNGLEDNYGVSLVKPDGSLEPVDASIKF